MMCVVVVWFKSDKTTVCNDLSPIFVTIWALFVTIWADLLLLSVNFVVTSFAQVHHNKLVKEMEEDLSRQFNAMGMSNGPPQLEIPQDNDENHDYQDDENDYSSSANCNLIVNYLPHDIDDIALRDLFAQ